MTTLPVIRKWKNGNIIFMAKCLAEMKPPAMDDTYFGSHITSYANGKPKFSKKQHKF